MSSHYYVIEQPTSEQWQQILAWAIARGHGIGWQYPDVRGPLPKPLRPLASQLVEVFTTCHYWGERHGRAVRVLLFAADDDVRAFLTSRSDLHAWDSPPPALSDPMVFGDQQVGAPLLWTIAHESLVFLHMDESEVSTWEAQYGIPLTLALGVEPPIIVKDAPCASRPWGDRLIMLISIVILLAFLGMAYYMAEGFIRLLMP